MKKQGTQSHRFLALIAVFIVMLAAPSCGNSQDLNRSNAKRLIQDSEKFKAPVTIVLKTEDDIRTFPESSEEDEQAVRARILRNYYDSYPAIAVLRHLGCVDAVATVVQPYEDKKVNGFPTRQPWIFKIEPTLTEKCKEMGKSQGNAGERALLVARRDVIEVTGIREKGGQAAGDFTWKATPTEVGKVFDPTSDAFKSLPPELRDALTKSRGIGPFGRSSTQDWSQTYKATASFQKYDDGWRVTSISSGSF